MSGAVMTPRYRCVRCGTTFTALAPAERHADSHRHCRLEVILAADVPTRPERGDPMSPKQKLAKDRRHGEKRMGQPQPIPEKNNPQPRRETK